ncbi:MAG: beta-phosphoglucomutase [Clostridiales bacterium]|nr:beta-phosphoglucomutase [Clostridiales bacterium]MBQ2768677.1 beta-phosphoglucomutase [Clostridia bacterium]
MKFKGAIFDLDGVICFTDELHYQAWKLLADRLGIYFDKEINNRLRGVSRMESLDIILERSNIAYSQEEKNAFAAEKNENYVKSLSSMSEKDVDETVVNSLKALRSFGVKLSIGSSSKNAKTILGRLGITELFDAVSDGTNITKSKPDPEVFLKAAEFLGLKPEECLVVEDAKAGIDAAKAGGFTAVGIGEAAEYEKTDYPIKSLKDLLAIV